MKFCSTAIHKVPRIRSSSFGQTVLAGIAPIRKTASSSPKQNVAPTIFLFLIRRFSKIIAFSILAMALTSCCSSSACCSKQGSTACSKTEAKGCCSKDGKKACSKEGKKACSKTEAENKK